MKIEDRGTIFEGMAGTQRAITCFPSLAVLSDGTVLATFSTASKKNGPDTCVLLSRSEDGGIPGAHP